MTNFIPGLQLSELFYKEVVGPIMARRFPILPYAASLIGSGSEVQGFDTQRSTDHAWGPRLLLLLTDDDYPQHAQDITEAMTHELPREFRNYPTNFARPDMAGTRTDSGPVNHQVEVSTARHLLHHALGIEQVETLDVVDWLTFPQQRLRELTSGAIYHDGVGEITATREALRWYPRDMWLYMLAAQWSRIAQEEPFIGRAGEVGDDLGSAVVAARVVRDLMRLCFLMERVYAPYSKWLGTAFARLACGPALLPLLSAVLRSASWQERERHLVPAYRIVAQMHNALNVTEPLSEEPQRFHDRPFFVSAGERFAHALLDQIEDQRVRALPPHVGAVDQFVDSTDVLSSTEVVRWLLKVYEEILP